MISAIIVEDDPFHMQVLCDLLQSTFHAIEIKGKCGSAAEGVKMIRELKPDLVMLDIDLPDQSGFEMLKQLEDVTFDLVFVTSHEKFALEAYSFDPSGYLLKPIDKNKLEQVIERLAINKDSKGFGKEFQSMLNAFKQAYEIPQKLAVPSMKEVFYISINNIVRLEADGNYTTIYLTNGDRVTSSKQIGEFENKLQHHRFFRLHDKHLVNLRFVKSFLKGESGIAVLEDNTQLQVSRRRKEAFLRHMDNLFE